MHQIYQGLSHVQQTPWEGYTYESKEFVVFGFSGYVYVLTDRWMDGWMDMQMRQYNCLSAFASRGTSKQNGRIKYLTMNIN